MAVINKRVFDTENALKGSFNGWWGKWQILTYVSFAVSYSIIVGWINELPNYTLLGPKNINCSNSTQSSNNITFDLLDPNLNEENYTQTFISNIGKTVPIQFNVLCNLDSNTKISRLVNVLGFISGSVLLGFASDRGGRKVIILASIWTTGIMSLFQMVGTDFISFVFFQFFVGLFVGGIQASFLTAIVEMFPINFRTFYGVFFHLIVCFFQLNLPWLAKSFKSWKLLQAFVTAPILLTAILQWLVYESIFWFLAHKEYDKAIKNLTILAKRNGILFETKFKQAKDFLHAKHSKATQVDLLPLLRLQDLDFLGKKYPQVDMVELQKNKDNDSKIRVFLNSLKGASYKSTNNIYNPFDFIYSPTMFVYVLILFGLWFTNGLTDSMIVIKPQNDMNVYFDSFILNLTCLVSSIAAILFSFVKIGRKGLIFFAYISLEICFLGSFITKYSYKQEETSTKIALTTLFHLSKFSSSFGLIFLMLTTVELFPTSLRCTGMGLCFSMKMLGSLISSPTMLDYNSEMHRLGYGVLTLIFGFLTLFLPETRSFPLPRSILQIEGMPTAIGRMLRSRKVKLAYENRKYEDNKKVKETHKSDEITEVSKGLLKKQDETASSSRNVNGQDSGNSKHYDTVTSVNDIEQDDYENYYGDKNLKQLRSNMASLGTMPNPFERTLTNIQEVPSKNITRNNSTSELNNSDGMATAKL